MIYIGIDPGTHTGVAVWSTKERKFIDVRTLKLHQALAYVGETCDWAKANDINVFLIFEDARLRKWYGNDPEIVRKKMKGAGSVERDCSVWEEFCEDNFIEYESKKPAKGMTKMSAESFNLYTGWQGRTSNHARDAGMLVFGR